MQFLLQRVQNLKLLSILRHLPVNDLTLHGCDWDSNNQAFDCEANVLTTGARTVWYHIYIWYMYQTVWTQSGLSPCGSNRLYHRHSFLSSPELKTQVSFSDHMSSVVCLSVRPSVCLSVNFSHFHLLLQNHWTNFNQTWLKAYLGEGDSSLVKWRAPPFSKGR